MFQAIILYHFHKKTNITIRNIYFFHSFQVKMIGFVIFLMHRLCLLIAFVPFESMKFEGENRVDNIM